MEVQRLYANKAQFSDDFNAQQNTVIGNSSVYEQIGASVERPLDLNLKFLAGRRDEDLSGQPSPSEM
jgi:hypothetical protein